MTTIDSDVVTKVTAERRSFAGELLGQVELDVAVFGVGMNVPLLHQVITAQLAARRSGTQSTRTRAEVKGGSAKPFRQKGTGNARQGSIRAPHYSGGGVAHGPKPRSYAQRTPRKMVQQGLRCALSDRAGSGRISVVDRWAFEVPKTKDAVRFLTAAGCSGRVLLVIGRDDELAVRSFANLPNVSTVPVDQLSAYDVLAADAIVFTDATLPGESVVIEQAAAPKPKRAAKPKAAEPESTPEPESDVSAVADVAVADVAVADVAVADVAADAGGVGSGDAATDDATDEESK